MILPINALKEKYLYILILDKTVFISGILDSPDIKVPSLFPSKKNKTKVTIHKIKLKKENKTYFMTSIESL